MERYLQALDELDDFWIAARQASLPLLALLLSACLGACSVLANAARLTGGVCRRLVLRFRPRALEELIAPEALIAPLAGRLDLSFGDRLADRLADRLGALGAVGARVSAVSCQLSAVSQEAKS